MNLSPKQIAEILSVFPDSREEFTVFRAGARQLFRGSFRYPNDLDLSTDTLKEIWDKLK